MGTRSRWIVRASIVALPIVLATVGLATTLPRLPQDLALPQGETSPGKVTFRHLTHVDQEKPDCTTCHPTLFKILEREGPAPAETTYHSEMDSGRRCGACHDGKAAFAVENCVACHLQE